MPQDGMTGSYSVLDYFTQNCDGLVKDPGNTGLVITNDEGYIIALLPGKNQESLYNQHTTAKVFNELLDHSSPLGLNRSYGKQPVCSTSDRCKYTCRGPKCIRNGKGIRDLSSRMTPDQRDELFRILVQAEGVMRGNLHPDYVRAHVTMLEKLGVPGFSGAHKKSGKIGATQIFPNIGFGKNVYLPAHVDEDCFLSITSVCDTEPSEHPKEILAYFCFPGESPFFARAPLYIFSRFPTFPFFPIILAHTLIPTQKLVSQLRLGMVIALSSTP